MEIPLRPSVNERDIGPAPDSVLPCQLLDRTFGAARLQPEKRLQLAVLEDAVLTFHRCLGARRARDRRLFAEVDAWFGSDDAEGPFAFATICDTLNLDPDYLRRGLALWRERLDRSTARRPPLRRGGSGAGPRVIVGPRTRIAC